MTLKAQKKPRKLVSNTYNPQQPQNPQPPQALLYPECTPGKKVQGISIDFTCLTIFMTFSHIIYKGKSFALCEIVN